ncbi:MAG: glutamine--fructose-6-phosphate aminotransferase, partial [Halobacteriales archaeon]|nr:glutamine--fructose-6-phosphate aminotransferase [Halobacteriales archaeon]
MCGITGYVGDRAALPILVGSLRNLEYRGYDSAGIALLNDHVDVYKRAGEVADLERELPADSPPSGTGLGHTRWSTHGKPTDENAHPHTDCKETVAVVHNGIIDNYD